jgi:hypothetical protein
MFPFLKSSRMMMEIWRYGDMEMHGAGALDGH